MKKREDYSTTLTFLIAILEEYGFHVNMIAEEDYGPRDDIRGRGAVSLSVTHETHL